jgi:hypothetical protein
MPPNFQLEGIDCAHAIRDKHPGPASSCSRRTTTRRTRSRCSARGQSGLAYLLKDRIAQGDELVRAIREVAAGGSAVDPTIAERLSGRRETAEHDRELLELMVAGLGYAQMAERLGTTQEAVDRRSPTCSRDGRRRGRRRERGRRDEAAARRRRREADRRGHAVLATCRSAWRGSRAARSNARSSR